MPSIDARPASPLPRKHPVLVVDDDVATVEILAHVLEDEGFEVAKAHSAAEARAAIARRCPNLVLLDVMLPDGDGRNLCHEFKSAAPTRDAFIILISGMAIGPQSRISGLNLGADEYLTKPVQPAEIVARIRSFLRIRETADALRHARDELELRVLERTGELQEANEQLHHAAGELRALSHRLLEAQERERRRLAHELHDEAGQTLTVLSYVFDTLEEPGRTPSAQTVADGRGALKRLTALIRNLWQELRPALLDDLGLLSALQWYFERIAANSGLRVDFRQEGIEGRRFDPDIETAAYRTTQEALTNVTRHAGVKEARVTVCADERALRVEIVDKGRGFETRGGRLSRDGSCGLVGMSERVRLLGGTFTLTSQIGEGTRLIAEFPLAEERPPEEPPAFTTLDTRMLRPADFAKPGPASTT